jgi:hypothetical protein
VLSTAISVYAAYVPQGEGARDAPTARQLTAAAVVLLPAASVPAVVKLTRIQYNPPGRDNGTNRHVNQ